MAKELPLDCWELILNRLHDNDYRLLQSPSLVCKQFLSVTNRIRRKIIAKHWKVFSGQGAFSCRAFERFRNLKEMELSPLLFGYHNRVDVDGPIQKIALSGLDLRALVLNNLPKAPSAGSLGKLGSTMKNLKTLSYKNFRSLGDPDLVHIADALPQLEELDIIEPCNNQFLTDTGIEVISRKLLGLRKINISGNYGCSDRSLIALSSNCVLLNEIRCNTCRITEHGICYVLRHSPNLTDFQACDYPSSSPPSLFTFDDSMVYAKALRTLDLCALHDQDRFLGSIAKAGIPLEKLVLRFGRGLSFHGLSTFLCACGPSLKHLELVRINFLNDYSMRDLCRYLPNAESITLATCSQLTIATFFILAKECRRLSEIKFTLYHHEICHFYAKPSPFSVVDDCLVDLETRNYRIGSLDLSNNGSLSDGWLKKIVITCPNLRTLDVRQCKELTKEGIGEILKCSSCQVKHGIQCFRRKS